MTSGEYWWRSWHGAPMDHKWAVIAARSGAKVGVVSAIAWALMDYASQNEDRGSVLGFDVELYAVYSGFSEDEIEAVLRAMNDKHFIEEGRLVNWEKRQPQREDNSRERVTRCREKKRSVTQCNASDTDTDTDTESETEGERENGADAPHPPQPAAEPDFEHLTVIEAQKIPEMREFLRATGRMPGRPLYRKVTDIMRERKFKANDLKPYWVEWNARGFNPNSIAWLAEWACGGAIPPARGAAANVPRDSGRNGKKDARAELADIVKELGDGNTG
jgi:hypothetical protein